MARTLGIDFGSARIGLALSDTLGWMAHPLKTLKTGPHSAEEIIKITQENEVTTIVVGLPRNMNGTYGPSAEKCQAFAAQLKSRTTLPIILWDERLTTVAATRHLHEAGLKVKEHRPIIDQVAAQQILQDWMDAQQHGIVPLL